MAVKQEQPALAEDKALSARRNEKGELLVPEQASSRRAWAPRASRRPRRRAAPRRLAQARGGEAPDVHEGQGRSLRHRRNEPALRLGPTRSVTDEINKESWLIETKRLGEGGPARRGGARPACTSTSARRSWRSSTRRSRSPASGTPACPSVSKQASVLRDTIAEHDEAAALLDDAPRSTGIGGRAVRRGGPRLSTSSTSCWTRSRSARGSRSADGGARHPRRR